MTEQLIFLLIPDHRWGTYIIQPARVIDNGDFYTYMGQYTERETNSTIEKNIIRLCNKLESGSLYKTYGRKKYKTERDFIEKADQEITKIIQSFTDKITNDILKELAGTDIGLFLRESRLDNPQKKDKIHISSDLIRISLGFYRNEESIRYRLTLIHEDEELIPSEHPIKIITNYPGYILLYNKLYSLPKEFSGLRLKPFLTKKEIIIPRQNEKEYFRKFILKNICNEDIKAEGFEIIERKAEKQPILSLERDITSNPIIELKFRYNNRTISYSSKSAAIVELQEEGEQYLFYKTNRDFVWEKACRDALLQENLIQLPSGYFRLPEENNWPEIIEWIRNNKETLYSKGFEITQEKLSAHYYTGKWKLKYTQESTHDWFQLHADIVLENGEVIPLQALWENILSGNPEYHYKENSVFVIPEEWFAKYSAIMLFGRKQKNQLLLHRNQYTLLEEKKPTAIHKESDTVDVPKKLKATLREYQLTGYRWLYSLYTQKMGACLADDMGLGKTIQTIALLLKYKEENKRKEEDLKIDDSYQMNLFETTEAIQNQQEEKENTAQTYFKTCLIVAPASVVHNWRNELQKFAPSLTVAEYTGSSRNALKQTIRRWDIVITTYQTLRNDINFLAHIPFGIVVLDESQSFKNRDSQVHQAVSQIQGDHFIALSGTPIENSLSDLWSLMYVINRGLLGNHATFYNYFIRPITADINGLHSESLRKLIAPFILRRTKEEVLKDLPERTDELIICETDEQQKKAYDEELSKARNRILEKALLQDKGKNDSFGSLQAIIRLRQIANHPKLADPDYNYSSGKFKEIFRMLEELVNTTHKVLLFSDYVSYLDLVAQEMETRGWEYTMLTGSTRNREEVINHFTNRAACKFFLISLKAGGVGLNLTEADYVFILDPWWNLAAEEQAISRSHRMGQKQAVFVYRFVTAGTLEEKILNIQKQKQDISDAIILSAENSFQPNEKELEKLLLE